MFQDFRSPQGPQGPRALEMYPSVGRAGAGGPRMSEVMAGAGGGPAASSPEIPMPKLMGGGRGGSSAPYAGSYKGDMSYAGPIKVAKGDTLSTIASRYGVSIQDLMKANPQIVDPNRIKAGAELRVPENAPGLSSKGDENSDLLIDDRRYRTKPGSRPALGHIMTAFDQGGDYNAILDQFDRSLAPPASSQFRQLAPSPAPMNATANMRGEGERLGQSIRDQILAMFRPTPIVEPMPGNPNYRGPR